MLGNRLGDLTADFLGGGQEALLGVSTLDLVQTDLVGVAAADVFLAAQASLGGCLGVKHRLARCAGAGDEGLDAFAKRSGDALLLAGLFCAKAKRIGVFFDGGSQSLFGRFALPDFKILTVWERKVLCHGVELCRH